MRRTLVLLTVLTASAVSAQPALRRATNLPALQAQPGFYHQRQVLVAGEVSRQENGRVSVTDGVSTIPIVFAGSVPSGPGEVRGTFWDIGRMNPDDPRFSSFDISGIVRRTEQDPWPRPGEVTAIVATAITPVTPPSAPTIRTLVLHPARYLDQTVTVAGQFGGRNLLGDLPGAPANSRWDFVLRTADAAIWVSNIRPRGRDFDLALDARFDTGRWLEVTGVVHQARGLQWIDAAGGSVALAKPVTETPTEEVTVVLPAAPAPSVVFSAPVEDELSVDPAGPVRVQFSRDINASTFEGRVEVAYVDPSGSGEPLPAKTFTTRYVPANRVLEIRFDPAMQPLRRVRVTLSEGILGTDTQPLAPFTLTFTTGS